MDLPANCDSAGCPQTDSLQHQGLCPASWHIPTPAEWSGLVQAAAGAGGSNNSLGISRLYPAGNNYWYSYTLDSLGHQVYTYTTGTDDFRFTLYPTNAGGSPGSGTTYTSYPTATVLPPLGKSSRWRVSSFTFGPSSGGGSAVSIGSGSYDLRCVEN